MLPTSPKTKEKEKEKVSTSVFLPSYDIRSLSLFSVLMLVFCFFMFLPILSISISAFNFADPVNFDKSFDISKPLESFTFLEHFTYCFENPIYRRGIFNAIFAGLMTTFICSLIGLTVTVIFSRYHFFGKKFFQFLTIFPLVSPPFVGAFAVSRLLARNGIVSNFLQQYIPGLPELLGHTIWGVIFIQSVHLWPLVYFNTAASYSKLDPALEEQARNLGSWGGNLYRQIILPLITPGFVAGAVLVFIWSISDLGTPIVLNFMEFAPYQAFAALREKRESYIEAAYALVFIILIVSLIALLFASRVVGMKDYAPEKVSGMEQTRLMQTASKPKTILFWVMLVTLYTLSMLPHIGIIIVAFVERIQYGEIIPTLWTFEGVTTALGRDDIIAMIFNSLIYAFFAMAITTIIGVIVGFLLVRKKYLRGISYVMLAIGGYVGLMLGAQLAFQFTGTTTKTSVMLGSTILMAVLFYGIGRLLNLRCLEIFSTMPFAIPGIVLASGYIVYFSDTTSIWGLLPPQLDTLPIFGEFTEGLRDFLLRRLGEKSPTSGQWGMTRFTSFWFILVVSYSMRRMPYTVQSSTAILRQIHESLEEVSHNLGASTKYTFRRITMPLMASGLLAGGILTFITSFTEVSTSILITPPNAVFKPIFPFPPVQGSSDPITKGIYDQIQRGDTTTAGVLGLIQMITAGTGMGITQKVMGERTGTVFGGG